MSSATRPLRERIVLIFDFDDTLAPSTTPTLFDYLDLDYEPISRELDQKQKEKWQYALAKVEIFRRLGAEGHPLTKEKMEEVGRQYQLFDGADSLMERLRRHAADLDDKVSLEFVLLTAGFGTIPQVSKIGQQFDRVYAGELNFGPDGKVIGAKRIITHEDKVHYILQLAKGLDIGKPSQLEDTYLDIDAREYYVPVNQIIYVGDGASDMSAFQTVEQYGGIGIAINKPDQEWKGYENMEPSRQVHNLANPDYSEASELMRTLRLGIELMIKRIQLLRMGRGE